MRINRAAVLTAACVTGLLGLPVPYAEAAEPPAVLYVDNSDPGACSDDGAGTRTQPFCTIQKAVDLAGPGQTVTVAYGTTYSAPLTITRSGEKGRPITIGTAERPGHPGGFAEVGSSVNTPSLTLSGVHDVVVQRLELRRGGVVSDSSQVSLDRMTAMNDSLKVTAASTDVTVSRSRAPRLIVDAGSSDTRFLRNSSGPIRIADAPDTVVTNNSAHFTCEPGIAVLGASPGTSVHNNVISYWSGAENCTGTPETVGMKVDASATTGTRVGSNALTIGNGAVAYSWAGTVQQSPESLAGATDNQAGVHDLMRAEYDDAVAIDSADTTAPGALESDSEGNPAADDPSVGNTGIGSPNYLDRGAFERQDPAGPDPVEVQLTYFQAPYGTDIEATAISTQALEHWPTSTATYVFDFGDGTVVTTTDPRAHHTYTGPCSCSVRVTASDRTTSHSPQTSQTFIEVTTPGELSARAKVQQDLPKDTDPNKYTSPLQITVDTSATSSPWGVVSTVTDYGDGKRDRSGGLASPRHQYAMPGDYTVRITVTDERGRTSTTSTQVHVDYAPSGFLKAEPYRLVDTRTEKVQGQNGGVIRPFSIPIGGFANPPVSGSISTVVLNVTVTGATEDTHLTVWPAGQPRPATSNVNVAAGKDSANLVTVPLGQAYSINTVLNSGHANLVIDVVGYYQPNAGEKFSPLAPSRVMDSRSAGGALKADTTRNVRVAGVGGVPANASAVVLNLTSTETTEDTYLTVWPHGSKRPTSSNLNPEPGRDKSNQVIVPVGPDGTVDLYNHVGTTHAVIDVFGYYGPDATSLFTPTVPRRLADTRPDALRQDSTLNVATGVPAGATAAVLNVTATDATDDTHLIVFPDGTTRPGTSNLNIGPRQTVPNHVITPLGANGKVDIYNHTGRTQVIADLFGYFTKS